MKKTVEFKVNPVNASDYLEQNLHVQSKLLHYAGKGYLFAFGLLTRWYIYSSDVNDSINSKF